MCVCMSECVHVCVISVWVPKEPVGRRAPIGNVIEEDLQLVVIVKVSDDNGADRGRHGKLLGCYVLRKKASMWYVSETHTHRKYFFCALNTFLEGESTSENAAAAITEHMESILITDLIWPAGVLIHKKCLYFSPYLCIGTFSSHLTAWFSFT